MNIVHVEFLYNYYYPLQSLFVVFVKVGEGYVQVTSVGIENKNPLFLCIVLVY